MFLRQDSSAAQLRRYVGDRRALRRGAGQEWLIAEAARRMLLPPLRDILPDLEEEPLGLRLTYATACVIIAGLLVQRFPGAAWSEIVSDAIQALGVRAGLDESELTKGASNMIAELTLAESAAYQEICRQFDGAVEYAVFRGHQAQGEVMLRLALERLEVLVHKQMAAANADDGRADVIRTHGLLRVVRRREMAA
jgi:hypothetical protein